MKKFFSLLFIPSIPYDHGIFKTLTSLINQFPIVEMDALYDQFQAAATHNTLTNGSLAGFVGRIKKGVNIKLRIYNNLKPLWSAFTAAIALKGKDVTKADRVKVVCD